MPDLEQVNAKRAGLGLRGCDHVRAFPGFTLFAPQSGGGNHGTWVRGSGSGSDILAGADPFPAR